VCSNDGGVGEPESRRRLEVCAIVRAAGLHAAHERRLAERAEAEARSRAEAAEADAIAARVASEGAAR